jgi:hypothetical protein
MDAGDKTILVRNIARFGMPDISRTTLGNPFIVP